MSSFRLFVLTKLSVLALLFVGCGSDRVPGDVVEIVPPDQPSLERAHAHNDYEHPAPLIDALNYGFTSIEADVHEIGGELYVAHNLFRIRPSRTLQKLYLDPLYELFKARNGRIRADGRPITLLVDVKAPAEQGFTALHEMLRPHSEMLTVFGPDSIRTGAVSVIISGNRDLDLIESAHPRLAAIDGRIRHLGDPDSILIPLISDKWTNYFDWMGKGPMPPEESRELKRIVETAHASGRRVRFWATPDKPTPGRTAVWDTLVAVGVDHINSDDLSWLSQYFQARR